jgi:predicted PurR-regulated permease PerM
MHLKATLVTAAAFAALLVLLYMLPQFTRILLLAFAGILLSVLLSSLAAILQRYTAMNHGFSLLTVILLIVGFFFLAGWIAGPSIMHQMSMLLDRIPAAFERFKNILMSQELGRKLLSNSSFNQQMLSMGSNLLDSITVIFSSTITTLGEVLIILFIGIYLAVDPKLYISNLIRLLPLNRRMRGEEVFIALGHALRWWLAGRFLSMFLVGILTTAGLAIVGIPLAFTLGLIAALFSFVPYIGAIVSAVPAGLVALVQGPTKVLVVIIVFLIVHFFEGYLITPLIQRRAVSLPPALLLIVQIFMGILAGVFGVLLATPLAVAVIVIIQMLYVEDVLGDQVKLLGEHH